MFKPIVGGKYNIRLLSGLKECMCISTDDNIQMAEVDIGGNVLVVKYNNIFPIPLLWSSDGDPEEEDDPDVCHSCGRIGVVAKTCCICYHCNRVLWGC